MNQTNMLPELEAKKLVPVVKLDNVEDAKPLGEALCKGGLPVAEVTFRTDAAEESIVARIYGLKGADLLIVSTNWEDPYEEEWDPSVKVPGPPFPIPDTLFPIE